MEGEWQRARENRNAKRVGNQRLNVCRGEWREREKDPSVNETEGEVNGDTREENQGIKEGRVERERAREKLLSSSQVVIRPRFVFT